MHEFFFFLKWCTNKKVEKNTAVTPFFSFPFSDFKHVIVFGIKYDKK